MDREAERLPPPARYFPVRPRPYRMEAGLVPFGRDFGNGPRDRLYFQVDDELDRYRRARREVGTRRHRLLEGGRARRACHEAVLAWMSAVLQREHPDLAGGTPRSYGALAAAVQEDFAVLRRRPDGRSEAVAVFVSFPSGWRPEAIGGADFARIHEPVPGFAENPAAAASMVTAMIERGPYVRFVWTVTADDRLDHHPDTSRRVAWADATQGWLRVERQVTVPFPAVGAALFLIRTYLYPFGSLGAGERRVLAAALEQMPPEIARYKGLAGEAGSIARRLLAG